MFVVDASVTLTWCFADETSDATEAVLGRLADERAIVPAIWQLEIVNVLLVAQRRNRLTEAVSSRFLELLLQLPIDVDDSPVDPARLLATGQSHGLSSYDAAYLLLAERMGAPLATLDQQLADAASRAGVELIV